MNTNSNNEKLVLVTGGSGFIAVHCILQLLNAGYHVRATLRNLDRESDVRMMLKEGGIENSKSLTFIQADWSADVNWNEAMKGCTYVLHVASPTPKLNYKLYRLILN